MKASVVLEMRGKSTFLRKVMSACIGYGPHVPTSRHVHVHVLSVTAYMYKCVGMCTWCTCLGLIIPWFEATSTLEVSYTDIHDTKKNTPRAKKFFQAGYIHVYR